MKHFLTVSLVLLAVTRAQSGVVSGTVYDARTGEPIPVATIRVVGTGRSMIANEDGRYRLSLPAGSYDLKFSHVAHHSRSVGITVSDSLAELNVHLQPALVEVASIRVYDRAYDAAQRIIIEAIARKDEILSKIREYSFEAYTKLIVRDTGKEDSSDIVVITETQLTAFWKYRDKYKEIITARKQTSNLEAEQNMVAIGEILNFNENRIDLGPHSVVSPTARDALDHYNYYLLDTTYIDGKTVFVLEIEPRSQTEPLFEGTIKIADSSFAVVGVDVGFNEGFDNTYFVNPRYRQVYSEFENEYWMPTLIQFTLLLDLKLPGIPTYSIDYMAALHKFDFDVDLPDSKFDEYVLEVDRDADKADSARWQAGQLVPLTGEEIYGYHRIDSLEHAPKPVPKRLLILAVRALALGLFDKDVFHFNRVEGAYLGWRHTFHDLHEPLQLRLAAGYAFDAKRWQHNYGFNYMIWPRQRVSVDVEYHDMIAAWPTLIFSQDGNATFMAITNKTDPYDYFREKGLAVRARTKLLNYTRLTVGYNDFGQHSIANNTEYSLFRESKKHRPNPAIIDGKLRSFALEFCFDSRKLIKYANRAERIFSLPFTRLEAGLEYASPGFVDNDFDFARYYLSLNRIQRLFGWGVSNVYVYAGASEKALPPQKYYTVDFGWSVFEESSSFHTLGESNFSGSRVLAVYVLHDFGRRLFRKIGLPLVNGIPLRLHIHGGIFWTDFKDNAPQAGDKLLKTAPDGYSEIGFGIGGLLPLQIAIDFTWQLTTYATNDFSISFSGGF